MIWTVFSRAEKLQMDRDYFESIPVEYCFVPLGSLQWNEWDHLLFCFKLEWIA